MIDFAANQSEGILKDSYHKFLKLFFRDILAICVFLKWSKVDVENVDSLLIRIVYQTYGIDLSYDSNDENRKHTKSKSKRNRKFKSFYSEDKDTPNKEIQDELKSYDVIKMDQLITDRTPNVRELVMMFEIITRHPKFAGLHSLNKDKELNELNETEPMKAFWDKFIKNLMYLK